MRTKMVYALFAVILYCTPANAKITLPAFFSDGMVLQQRSKVKIWGFANPFSKINIQTSWDGEVYRFTAGKDGSWITDLKTPAAGGPYTINLNDGERLTLNNILIGEVWLASGQSNMEMPLKGFDSIQVIKDAGKFIGEQANDQIRFFIVKNTSWKKPSKSCSGIWQDASPQNKAGFSALAYLYAKELQEKLKVPVGIIESDWGGTLIEAWMSKEVLVKTIGGRGVPAEKDSTNLGKNAHAGLFNGMIYPLLGYSIKGAIWYQGEQNRLEPKKYRKLFPAMVQQWRKDWGIGEFPFYYMQIAPFASKRAAANSEEKKVIPLVPFLREVQLQSLEKIPNSGMAVLIDIGAERTIHPADKQTAALRLAHLAVARTYGFKNIPFQGPQYLNYKVQGNELILNFEFSAKGLRLTENSPNFELAGADQKFYPAKAVLKGRSVILTSDNVSTPLAARYAFSAWARGDLYNTEGLPASSFRTDNWPLPKSDLSN